jgi:hypothetical protein
MLIYNDLVHYLSENFQLLKCCETPRTGPLATAIASVFAQLFQSLVLTIYCSLYNDTNFGF